MERENKVQVAKRGDHLKKEVQVTNGNPEYGVKKSYYFLNNQQGKIAAISLHPHCSKD